ncbi:translation initiation factor IF-2 [Candidatus Poribacteria bacterium]|nr:translation initiation factor IF-2 [Candidatus Poribacteria bacterium]
MSRVYEIAKEVGTDSKSLLNKLNEMGIQVKTHMSSLDEVTIKKIRQMYAAQTLPETPKPVKKHTLVVEEKKVLAEEVVPIKTVEVEKPIEEKPIEIAPVKEVIETEKKELEQKQEEEIPKEPEIKIIKVNTDGIIVSELAKKMNIPSNDLIKKMIEMGIFAAINQRLDMDTAILVASEYNYDIEHVPLYGEDILGQEEKEDPARLKPRSPVVTIMGHVDHGKTKLLDAIRQTNIIDTEAGGITQHIGAYLVEFKKGKIVFLDTPGHAAFTAMRARGAQVTDIVVLVVAADDGVMPQTVEAIDHAKSAQVPIIVAINKIDKPEANIERVKRQLSDHGLVPEEWGGKTIYVEISAKQKIGLENLLEMILLESEMLELKANPDKLAKGIILEAKLDRGRGSVATVLVQEGTLEVGDVFVTGAFYGKVRAMHNDLGKRLKEAGPSTPVEILGLSGVPQAGDLFQVAKDEKTARQISIKRQEIQREKTWGAKQHITLEDLYKKIQEGNIKELNIIFKADVQGSVEALTGALNQIESSQIKLKVIHGATGNITETDVMLAAASNAIIIGFNVKPEPKAEELALKEKVDIKIYNIIYEILNVVKAAMEGMLEPVYKEVYSGKAEVRELFKIPKMGNIAGSYVIEGEILRNAQIKVVRQGEKIFEGKLSSLKRFKDDVKNVQTNFECGIGIANFDDIQPGDIIEAYKVEQVIQKL